MRAPSLLLILAVVASVPHPALGAEFGGNARVYAGTTSREDGSEDDILRETYTFNIRQPLTPWVTVLGTYQERSLGLTDEQGVEFERTSRSPLVEFAYRRSTFDARVGYQEREIKGTSPADRLESEAVFGRLGWSPRKGPVFSLAVRDEQSVADPTVFGRDAETTLVDFDAAYRRPLWSLTYSYEDLSIDSATRGLAIDQRRHVVRSLWGHSWLDDRVDLAADITLSRAEQDERFRRGTTIAEPIPAVAGLFAVDLTPGIGELDPAPGLVDGERDEPTVPPIDIGGASTFRNVGLDLALSQPATRLEIFVDRLSEPGLAWDVYQSPDNLTWERVGGVTATFDPTLLFYSLEFPETTARYFKAVNRSVNTQPIVLVTEVRALVDVPQADRRERESDTARAFVQARFDPTARWSLSFNGGYSEDSGAIAGLIARDTRQSSWDLRASFLATPSVRVSGSYYWSDFEREDRVPLAREEERWSSALVWAPFPTVQGELSFVRREETDATELLRRSDNARLQGTFQVLADLRWISEVDWSDVADPFSGFGLRSWGLRQYVEAQPWSWWSFSAGASTTRFASTGRIDLSRRTNGFVDSNLRLAPALRLALGFTYGREDGRETLTQRYNLAWSPGRKLGLSFSYYESDSVETTETSTAGANLDYRLNRHLSLFSTFSRSELRGGTDLISRVTSWTAGMNLSL
jgi:hypothetical protein